MSFFQDMTFTMARVVQALAAQALATRMDQLHSAAKYTRNFLMVTEAKVQRQPVQVYTTAVLAVRNME